MARYVAVEKTKSNQYTFRNLEQVVRRWDHFLSSSLRVNLLYIIVLEANLALVGDSVRAKVIEDHAGRRLAENACETPCAIERGMRILGGKWTGSILWHLKDEPVRFNDLARMIGGASKKMITERLRQLEAQGLITRKVLATAPVSVEYRITPLGETALGCLDALREWSDGLPESIWTATPSS